MDYQKIFQEEIDRCEALAKNDKEIIEKIRWKKGHSLRVLNFGLKIMDGEGGNWDKSLAKACLLLHDIGRFEQSLANSFSDKKTKINHALLGAKKLKKMGLPKVIVEAVGEHNNPNYMGDNQYVHLVREADQLAIMSEWDYQVTELKSQGLSEYAIKKWNSREIMDWKYCNGGKEDKILMIESWANKFWFGTSKVLYKEMGVGKKIKEELGDNLTLLTTAVDDFA